MNVDNFSNMTYDYIQMNFGRLLRFMALKSISDKGEWASLSTTFDEIFPWGLFVIHVPLSHHLILNTNCESGFHKHTSITRALTLCHTL